MRGPAHEDSGAGIAEYALLVVGIAIVAIGAVRGLGGSLSAAFSGFVTALGF